MITPRLDNKIIDPPRHCAKEPDGVVMSRSSSQLTAPTWVAPDSNTDHDNFVSVPGRRQQIGMAEECYRHIVRSMQVCALAGWTVTLGTVALLTGCGGSTDSNRREAGAGSSAYANGGALVQGGVANDAGRSPSGAAGTGGAPPDRIIDGFDSDSPMATIGLWMSIPGGGNRLPIDTPAVPHDGSALHLVGVTDAEGLDMFFHTALPFERIFGGARFWVQSGNPGSKLTVAVAGPEPLYFEDRAQGIDWPQRAITLTSEWQEVVIDFDDWDVDAQHLSPRSEMFGAFHFIVEPNTAYDFWIDDFVGVPPHP
jgi:hypothetical protein